MNSLLKKLLVPVFLILFVFGIALFLITPQLTPKSGFILWERDLGDNIADFTVADGKVFALTFHGDLFCLDQQNGETVWSQSLGGYVMWYLGELIKVACDKVYVGSQGSVVNCLDKESGSVLWSYQPPISSSIASKSPPSFSIVDGRVFTHGDGFYALNASDGALFWSYEFYESTPDFVRGWGFEGNRVYGTGIEEGEEYLYRFNPANGDVLWKVELYVPRVPMIVDGRIIIWNFDDCQEMLCIREDFGSTCWNYSVDALIFRPLVKEDLVLFGTSNGSFYALDQQDGTLKWKYQATKEVVGQYTEFGSPKASSNKIFLVFEEKTISSLNLSNGQPLWNTEVTGDLGDFGGFVLSEDSLYYGIGAINYEPCTDLCSVDLDSGKMNWSLDFKYWVLPPIYHDTRLFVAADLKIIAYNTLKHPSS